MEGKSLLAALLGLTVASVLWFTMLTQAPSIGVGFEIQTHSGAVVVSDADIASYSASSHELTLTRECAARLEAGHFLEGDFRVLVNGEAVVTGIFVPPFVSRSYPASDIVISYPSFDMKYDVMKIQRGYPWALPGTPGVDDSALAAYFASTGRLTP